MVNWDVVPICNNPSCFISITNNGRFYFSKQIRLYLESNHFKFVRCVSCEEDGVLLFGFKFLSEFVDYSFQIHFSKKNCLFYSRMLTKLILKIRTSCSYDLKYDKENDVWYF